MCYALPADRVALNVLGIYIHIFTFGRNKMAVMEIRGTGG
jgi:hypothetical protein